MIPAFKNQGRVCVSYFLSANLQKKECCNKSEIQRILVKFLTLFNHCFEVIIRGEVIATRVIFENLKKDVPASLPQENRYGVDVCIGPYETIMEMGSECKPHTHFLHKNTQFPT